MRDFCFFPCTFAAIPRAGRNAFSRMKPVASSWLQDFISLVSIMANSRRQFVISGKGNRKDQNKIQSATFANGRKYVVGVGNFSETFAWLPGISIIGNFRFPKMKTRIMKHLLRILPVTLFAVALMQLYQANMELKYNYEALTWQMKNKTDQFDAIIAANFQRTHQEVQKMAKLEAQQRH